MADHAIYFYFEETGIELPTVLVHKFVSHMRSVEPLVRYFPWHHRCIAFNRSLVIPACVMHRCRIGVTRSIRKNRMPSIGIARHLQYLRYRALAQRSRAR